ncbi:hypothetical protein RchiOBHm_Chr5g0037721 [Rosa chinensis]|uniref:Secreted protein n=1 Tax=Rosa chinensis TaxID=74649 RepID=A0A2P6QBU5_ROSCH|nr:hypothetical protein RchiOBHm_Chr5g0037721 [Rosa chinensis]
MGTRLLKFCLAVSFFSPKTAASGTVLLPRRVCPYLVRTLKTRLAIPLVTSSLYSQRCRWLLMFLGWVGIDPRLCSWISTMMVSVVYYSGARVGGDVALTALLGLGGSFLV